MSVREKVCMRVRLVAPSKKVFAFGLERERERERERNKRRGCLTSAHFGEAGPNRGFLT